MLNSPAGPTQTKAALFLTAAMALTVGTALGFEHVGGFIPCKLCLEQREPYYAAIPLMALAAVSSWRAWPAWITRGLLTIGGLLMTYGLMLAIYHSGVEWAWWPGPADCTAAANAPQSTAGNLLSTIDKVVPPSCDQAAGRFLGLSFAGWNAVASLVLASIALRAGLGGKDRA